MWILTIYLSVSFQASKSWLNADFNHLFVSFQASKSWLDMDFNHLFVCGQVKKFGISAADVLW